MNKYEFITALQKHLTGKVSVQKLNELTDYYNDYIDSEIRKGKSEDEVLAALGEPRLLAKSIAETEGASSAEQADFHEDYENFGERGQSARFTVNGKDVSRWQIRFIGIIALIIVVSILFLILKVLGFALGLILKYVLPVLIPVAVIWFVIEIISGK